MWDKLAKELEGGVETDKRPVLMAALERWQEVTERLSALEKRHAAAKAALVNLPAERDAAVAAGDKARADKVRAELREAEAVVAEENAISVTAELLQKAVGDVARVLVVPSTAESVTAYKDLETAVIGMERAVRRYYALKARHREICRGVSTAEARPVTLDGFPPPSGDTLLMLRVMAREKGIEG